MENAIQQREATPVSVMNTTAQMCLGFTTAGSGRQISVSENALARANALFSDITASDEPTGSKLPPSSTSSEEEFFSLDPQFNNNTPQLVTGVETQIPLPSQSADQPKWLHIEKDNSPSRAKRLKTGKLNLHSIGLNCRVSSGLGDNHARNKSPSPDSSLDRASCNAHGNSETSTTRNPRRNTLSTVLHKPSSFKQPHPTSTVVQHRSDPLLATQVSPAARKGFVAPRKGFDQTREARERESPHGQPDDVEKAHESARPHVLLPVFISVFLCS